MLRAAGNAVIRAEIPNSKLWRGRGAYPEVLETARDASKATAEVASGC
jgi:hypothetical protein